MNGGYYPQWQPAPASVPQSGGQSALLQQQVAQGIFPYLNRAEIVGQIFSLDQDGGISWKDGQNGKQGHLELTIKLRKAWDGQNPGVKQTTVKVIAFGQLGQQIRGQVRPGLIIRAVGEIKINRFPIKSGPQAGQWSTSVQILLRGGQNSEVPFEVLGGPLPIVDERQQQGGYPQGGYPLQQPAYPPQNVYHGPPQFHQSPPPPPSPTAFAGGAQPFAPVSPYSSAMLPPQFPPPPPPLPQGTMGAMPGQPFTPPSGMPPMPPQGGYPGPFPGPR